MKWIKSIQRRDRIEGLFGTLKSRSGIGLTKGYFAMGRHVQHKILGTIALAVLNYQTTIAWIERGGITNDDVFDPAPTFFGKKEMTGGENQERRTVHFKSGRSEQRSSQHAQDLCGSPGGGFRISRIPRSKSTKLQLRF
jgi:hypothetical protein